MFCNTGKLYEIQFSVSTCKVFWAPSHACSFIAHGCFHATVAELSHCDNDAVACNAENIYSLGFSEQSCCSLPEVTVTFTTSICLSHHCLLGSQLLCRLLSVPRWKHLPLSLHMADSVCPPPPGPGQTHGPVLIPLATAWPCWVRSPSCCFLGTLYISLEDT